MIGSVINADSDSIPPSEIRDEHSPSTPGERSNDEDLSVNHQLEICRAQNEELMGRLERIESVFNASHLNPDLEDASLLEVMFKTAQEKIFTSIPATDEECSFNWLTGKCNPSCKCAFQPKLGDYTPSRACRLIDTPGDEQTCDSSSDKREEPWAAKLMKGVSKAAKKAATTIHEKLDQIAPPTDHECRFSLKDMKCVPDDLCTFDFQWGDFHPGRSCRYRLDDLFDGDE
jgi:hypothetical protein